MSEVLIDDSSLNAIAHSIRRKNGLLRTYKPREMAPAIRAFNDFIPDAHSFTINVQQSPHQTIRLRKYLDADQHEYTNTFTVSEPFYKADIIVEADAGYEAGKPNYESPITIDRDMVISASPAENSSEQPSHVLYTNGSRQGGNAAMIRLYTDEECSNQANKESYYGKLHIIDVSPDGLPYDGSNFCGVPSGWIWDACRNITELTTNFNTSQKTSLSACFGQCSNLRKIDVSGFDTRQVTNFVECFVGCGSLRRLDITSWNFAEARDLYRMFYGCGYLESFVMPHTDSPYLTRIAQIFSGCSRLKVIDISGFDTSAVDDNGNEFKDCSRLQYIIIDHESVRLHHYFNDIPSSCKILVPQILIQDYQAAYPSHSSKFNDISNYTITRYGGQVFVTPNN